MSSLFSAAGPSCPPAPTAAVTRAGPPPSARRGIYAHPLPAASALFHIRSVAEPSWSPDDGGVYEPKPFVYIAWRSLLIGTGLGLFGATFQVGSPAVLLELPSLPDLPADAPAPLPSPPRRTPTTTAASTGCRSSLSTAGRSACVVRCRLLPLRLEARPDKG